jgi:hypothetical protein
MERGGGIMRGSGIRGYEAAAPENVRGRHGRTREVEVLAEERCRHQQMRTREQKGHDKRQQRNKRQRQQQTGDDMAACVDGGPCLKDQNACRVCKNYAPSGKKKL